jgi:hypothetical protein
MLLGYIGRPGMQTEVRDQRSENDEARMTNEELMLVLVIESEVRNQRSEIRYQKTQAASTEQRARSGKVT